MRFSFPLLVAAPLLAAAVTGCAKAPAPAALPAGPGPHNAPIAAIGRPEAPPVDDRQKAEITQLAATVPAAVRARLRYAIAADEAGKPVLAVYDGQNLAANGSSGKKFAYVVFKLVNATDGSTYDPQQNAVQAAIPPPAERDLVSIKTN